MLRSKVAAQQPSDAEPQKLETWQECCPKPLSLSEFPDEIYFSNQTQSTRSALITERFEEKQTDKLFRKRFWPLWVYSRPSGKALLSTKATRVSVI